MTTIISDHALSAMQTLHNLGRPPTSAEVADAVKADIDKLARLHVRDPGGWPDAEAKSASAHLCRMVARKMIDKELQPVVAAYIAAQNALHPLIFDYDHAIEAIDTLQSKCTDLIDALTTEADQMEGYNNGTA